MTTPRLRPAVRALILSDTLEVLLVHFKLATANFWATPGGGVESTESELDALHRELREEVGLHDPVIEGPIWKREHVFPMKHWDGQADCFYLVRTQRFSPKPVMTTEELLAEGVVDMRWWSASDMDASSEEFSPRELARLLRDLMAHGAPATPLTIGV
jgi:8-oxo-dGTP pyrophosphatase MutT (NUDIX family)